jgi:acyl carrier protein
MLDVRTTLKQSLVTELRLEDVTPDEIADDAPLFGNGLGLDSLDAIELVVLVKKHFGVDMEDAEDTRQAFASLNALVAHIETRMR